MVLTEEYYILDQKEILLRSARLDEVQLLIDYLKIVTGETRFLMCEPDEIKYTQKEEEQQFIMQIKLRQQVLRRKLPITINII